MAGRQVSDGPDGLATRDDTLRHSTSDGRGVSGVTDRDEVGLASDIKEMLRDIVSAADAGTNSARRTGGRGRGGNLPAAAASAWDLARRLRYAAAAGHGIGHGPLPPAQGHLSPPSRVQPIRGRGDSSEDVVSGLKGRDRREDGETGSAYRRLVGNNGDVEEVEPTEMRARTRLSRPSPEDGSWGDGERGRRSRGASGDGRDDGGRSDDRLSGFRGELHFNTPTRTSFLTLSVPS